MAAVLAWLRLLLNPLNWLKVASAISSIAGVINSLLTAVKDWKANKAKDQLDKAQQNDAAAQVITDEAERLRKKAHAACQIEKVNNPDADCDDGTGK